MTLVTVSGLQWKVLLHQVEILLLSMQRSRSFAENRLDLFQLNEVVQLQTH